MQFGAVGAKRFVRMSVSQCKRKRGRKQDEERPEVLTQAERKGLVILIHVFDVVVVIIVVVVVLLV